MKTIILDKICESLKALTGLPSCHTAIAARIEKNTILVRFSAMVVDSRNEKGFTVNLDVWNPGQGLVCVEKDIHCQNDLGQELLPESPWKTLIGDSTAAVIGLNGVDAGTLRNEINRVLLFELENNPEHITEEVKDQWHRALKLTTSIRNGD